MNEENDFEGETPESPETPAHQGKRPLIPTRHFKRLGRELAMQFLFQCDVAGMSDFAEILENFWIQAENSGEFPAGRIFRKARSYAEKIIAGVCEHETEIDEVISTVSDKWDISRMPVVDRNIIRVAVFELYYCPDIPAVVSIDEAIEIAKDFSSAKSGLFINGLLNTVKDRLPPGAKLPDAGRKKEGQ
ncbi:MAG: transcription antitermination factor NusB [Lentisphaeria bacterium]|nr:transcription antitermination factor NusB [Lentisphaeria bacterium]